MTTLVSLVAAADGRYVAAAHEGAAEWHIYVAWESGERLRRRTRWWNASAVWDAALVAAIERAWHSPHLHVQLLDYDTPDEEADVHAPVTESCMLTVRTCSHTDPHGAGPPRRDTLAVQRTRGGLC